jgi:hypothetical protein
MKRAVALTVAGAFALAACGDDGGGSVEAFCESAQEVADNTQDPFDTDSPEDFVAELEKQRDAVNAAADNAPDEISDDAQTAAEYFAEVSDALAAVDPTDQAAVEEASAPFDEVDPEVEAAGESVGEFALTECGIDLDESG